MRAASGRAMPRKMATTGTFLAVAFFMAGCAAPVQPRDTLPAPTDPVAAIVQAARADASRRSGLAPATLALVSLESVEWADGSLGCPEPGRLYPQALVPGWRLRLRVGREVWDYHAARRGGLVLCPPGRARPPASYGSTRTSVGRVTAGTPP